MVGGYNPVSWNSTGTYTITPIVSERIAFLFNLTQTIKLQQRSDFRGYYQTINVSDYGPTFGAGADIFVNYGLSAGYSSLWSYHNNSNSNTSRGKSLVSGLPYAGATISYAEIEVFTVAVGPADADGDGVLDPSDNCPNTVNPDQTDTDGDTLGNACDPDDDNDGVADNFDNCPTTLGGNTNQTDTDSDGAGDICDTDLDGDGVLNTVDICPTISDPFQEDNDSDGAGDACDDNDDHDTILDVADNCPFNDNEDQADLDADNIGDVCDADDDGDGIDDGLENCPVVANVDQTDTDGDTEGDACDADDDADGVLDAADNCPLASNSDQADTDGDGVGNACNSALDADGDEWADSLDNCPSVANGNQYDWNNDGEGDACDNDIDGDGVLNGLDVCAFTQIGGIVDPSNGCTIAQLCPCDGPVGTSSEWRNHGIFVSCVAKTANSFADQDLILQAEKDEIVSEAASSKCGKK